jgi:hypothetical protein
VHVGRQLHAGGYCTDASGQQAFLVSEVNDADPAETFDAFDRECAASRQAVAQAPSLDVLGKQPSERTGQPWSLRWIVTHMIEEHARHNGHADLLRERVDGSAGLLLSSPLRPRLWFAPRPARPPAAADAAPAARHAEWPARTADPAGPA